MYKHSQQGWDHIDKRACGIYHRHTQKGGHRSSLPTSSQILLFFALAQECGCGPLKNLISFLILKNTINLTPQFILFGN